MYIDIIKSIFYAGLPVGVFSFLMVYYAYFKRYISPSVSIRKAFKEKNNPDQKLSKQNKKELLFLHSKWITFGGGFYGLVALLTFIYIELEQMILFVLNATGLHSYLDLFSISAIITMFIESILNMIKAALWFSYWPDVFNMSNRFMWIVVAYLGYRIGAKLAQRYALQKVFVD